MQLSPTAAKALKKCAELSSSILSGEIDDGEILRKTWFLHRDLQLLQPEAETTPDMSSLTYIPGDRDES